MRRLALPLLLALAQVGTAAPVLPDRLDVPARHSALSSKRLLNGLAQTNGIVLAVGQRGHILRSDDQGISWHQVSVPTSVDLTAAYLLPSGQAWAVGHDGVVLYSADAGKSWRLQLDGRGIEKLLATYSATTHEHPAGEASTLEILTAQGVGQSLLDVCFVDPLNGYVVGAFGLVLRTRDGGATWTPWMAHVDNPRNLHLYGIRNVRGDLYVAGEQGLVLKQPHGADHFGVLSTPYKGTYFGIAGHPDWLLVYGLGGNAYRSADGGTSWEKVALPSASGVTGATVLDAANVLLTNQAGELMTSSDGARSFRRVALSTNFPLTAVSAAQQGPVMLAGTRGIASVGRPLRIAQQAGGAQ
jgi:photosystem II stability/assembly factor-like uncharacterized protein